MNIAPIGPITVVIVALAIGYRPLPAAAQDARLALSEPARTLLLRWLTEDCTRDAGVLVARLRRAGDAMERALAEAYRSGPDAHAEEVFLAPLDTVYRTRTQWLKERGVDALGQDAVDLLLAETEDEFRADEVGRFRARWRDAALAGLGQLCTPGATKTLAFAASDKAHVHGHTAALALAACLENHAATQLRRRHLGDEVAQGRTREKSDRARLESERIAPHR